MGTIYDMSQFAFFRGEGTSFTLVCGKLGFADFNVVGTHFCPLLRLELEVALSDDSVRMMKLVLVHSVHQNYPFPILR